MNSRFGEKHLLAKSEKKRINPVVRDEHIQPSFWLNCLFRIRIGFLYH